MEKYDVLELIGEGSFGRVFRGIRKSDSFPVALKLIPKMGHTSSELSSLRSECKIQLQLSHPNVVKMLDAFETPKEIVAVTEFVPDGDLNKLLIAGHGKHKAELSRLPESKVQQLAGDLMGALHYLHSRRVLHRDLKPANVLLDEKQNLAKLCDFGFARHLGVETMVLTSIKGTPLYMAPELIEERPYDHTADLWSAGAILYELSVGHPPFPTNSLFQLIKKIRYEQIIWPSFLSEDLSAFLQGLLEKDCKKRLSWPQLLHHPFLKNTSFNFTIQRQNTTLKSDSESTSTPGVLSPPFSNAFSPPPLTETLSESQELAKEIQRQDKAKLLPGGSQTLIKVAEKYEAQKRKLKEEQLKLLQYHHQHQLQLQQKQPHQVSSGYNAPYQQRRNAITPGFDHYYNATRRNSEIPTSNRVLIPLAKKLDQNGIAKAANEIYFESRLAFQRRPSNLAEYCQQGLRPQDCMQLEPKSPFASKTTKANFLSTPACENELSSEVLTSPILNHDVVKTENTKDTTEREGVKHCQNEEKKYGKTFEFSIEDCEKECSSTSLLECDEWCRYLDAEMQEIVSFQSKQTSGGSIDFLLNQNYLSMICSPLKNSKAIMSNPIIVEKIATLLSLPFVAINTVIPTESNLTNINKQHELEYQILNRYSSVKIFNRLLFAFKHCTNSMMIEVETASESKDKQKVNKKTQILRSLSSLLQLCIRLLYSQHSNENILMALIKQFCIATAALNLDESFRHLLLIQKTKGEENSEICLRKDVKIEIISIMNKLLAVPFCASGNSPNGEKILAVNTIRQIFCFDGECNAVNVSQLIENEDASNHSSQQIIVKSIYFMALWARIDQQFKSTIRFSQGNIKNYLEIFAKSDNIKLQKCAQFCSERIFSENSTVQESEP